MVSHLAIHSPFTQATDACLTAQFGQLLLSVCDACYVCLALWFQLQVCQGESNVSRLYNPLAAVLLLQAGYNILVPYLNKRSKYVFLDIPSVPAPQRRLRVRFS